MNKKYIQLLVLHALIGFLVFIFEPISKVYLFCLTAYFFYKIVNAKNQNAFYHVLMACSYVVGGEIFIRMTGANIFYEVSKYLVLLFVFMGMLISGVNSKSYPYFIYLILLIPGIFVAGMAVSYSTNIRTAIAFNLSGPVCLGIVALYCYDKKIEFKELQRIMLGALLPVFTTAIYLFFYTPNLRDVLTGTGSNFAASGGYGPNQVSTILGLGMFIITTRVFLNSKTFFTKVINIFILVLISYRGIVTFSRGGILVALIIITAFLVIYYYSSKQINRNKILRMTFIFLAIGIFIWIFSSIQTMGLIDKRYANQDAAGRVKDDVTTGRTELLSFEIDEFVKNPFLGIGVGKVKEIRYELEGINAASHNEMTRIIAEHGLFGLFAFLIIFILPLSFRIKNRKNIFFYSFYLFWFLTINHSSMRIAAPAFIYGLSLLNVQYEKNPLHRKQIKPRKF